MSALNLLGSTSNIANAANTNFESNINSFSTNLNHWKNSRSDLTNSEVLSKSVKSQLLGALSSLLCSVPLTVWDTIKVIADNDDMKYVTSLVYSLTLEKDGKILFDNIKKENQLKFVRRAYEEFGIKIDGEIDIKVESIREKLLSAIDKKIASLLQVKDLSDKKTFKLGTLVKLKRCLTTGSLL